MANRSREHTPEEADTSEDGAVVIPGKPERALKHEFACKKGGPPEYKFCQGEWVKSVVSCVIDDIPFSEGALRQVYRMQIVAKDGRRHDVVAKVSKDPNEERSTYYRDVQAQMCAREWAAEYNSQSVPKPIDFVPAYVFELVDRPGRPLIGVEEFVEGVFIKHNNNVGGIMTAGGESERATPNAFSHFTWEASAHTLLVCDIQGVNDRYTDPQIHTASGKGFGRGNLGEAGLKAFLSRHRCTQICEALALPAVGGSGVLEQRKGTPVLRSALSSSSLTSFTSCGPASPELAPADAPARQHLPDLTLQGAAIAIPAHLPAHISVSSALPDTEAVVLAAAPRERSFKRREEEEGGGGRPSRRRPRPPTLRRLSTSTTTSSWTRSSTSSATSDPNPPSSSLSRSWGPSSSLSRSPLRADQAFSLSLPLSPRGKPHVLVGLRYAKVDS